MKKAFVKAKTKRATVQKLISIFLPSSVSRIPKISLPVIFHSFGPGTGRDGLHNFVTNSPISLKSAKRFICPPVASSQFAEIRNPLK